MNALGADIPADLEIDCPRCGAAVTVRFAGPCDDCRTELRASQRSEAGHRSEVEYEPKMNVVPNAVASKE